MVKGGRGAIDVDSPATRCTGDVEAGHGDLLASCTADIEDGPGLVLPVENRLPRMIGTQGDAGCDRERLGEHVSAVGELEDVSAGRRGQQGVEVVGRRHVDHAMRLQYRLPGERSHKYRSH